MPKRFNIPVDYKGIMLENILIAMSKHTFCKTLAAKIVGGPKRLEDLIEAGEIEADKGTSAQNSKWQCNAAQVLMHCRNMRKKFNNDQ